MSHPVSGLDHILAMIAVGLWGAQLGAPAIWLLPVTFPMVMAFGGTLGLVGVKLPGIEIGIALVENPQRTGFAGHVVVALGQVHGPGGHGLCGVRRGRRGVTRGRGPQAGEQDPRREQRLEERHGPPRDHADARR